MEAVRVWPHIRYNVVFTILHEGTLLFHSDAVIWREDFRVRPAISLSLLALAPFSSSGLFSWLLSSYWFQFGVVVLGVILRRACGKQPGTNELYSAFILLLVASWPQHGCLTIDILPKLDKKKREILSVRYQQVSCCSKNISRGSS